MYPTRFVFELSLPDIICGVDLVSVMSCTADVSGFTKPDVSSVGVEVEVKPAGVEGRRLVHAEAIDVLFVVEPEANVEFEFIRGDAFILVEVEVSAIFDEACRVFLDVCLEHRGDEFGQ